MGLRARHLKAARDGRPTKTGFFQWPAKFSSRPSATGCQDASVPAAPHPLITRRTDFGTRDAYVASLKGVILSLKPAAQPVDLSHEVASHHTLAGPAVAG